jgi:ABC-type tungstate transport system permease subunit
LARDLQDRRYGLTPSLRKSPFLGPAFAQLDDTGQIDRCALCGGVGVGAWQALKAGNAGDVDDRTVAPLLHLRDHEPTHVKDRVEVDRHDLNPFF